LITAPEIFSVRRWRGTLAADAPVLKVRENGRVVGVHTLIATGVNADGYCEILGVQVVLSARQFLCRSRATVSCNEPCNAVVA